MVTTHRMIRHLATACGAAALTFAAVHARAASAEEDHVRAAAAAFAAFEKADVELLSKKIDGLLNDAALLAPFLARDREKLLAAAQPRFDKLKAEWNITHWYFLEPEPARTCFLRVHKPPQHGDVVMRDTFSQAIASHELGYGMELGKNVFALRVVKPIRVDGKIVGYLELAEEIDHFLDRMKNGSGDDFGVLVDKERVDRGELARIRNDDRWDERPDVVLIASTMWDEKRIDLGRPLAKLPAEGVILPGWKDGAKTYVGGAFPLKNAKKAVVGALFVRHPVTPK